MTISGHQISVSALLAVRSSSKLSHRRPGYSPIARTRLAKPTSIAFHVGMRWTRVGGNAKLAWALTPSGCLLSCAGRLRKVGSRG
jgi:hypothetical protein